MDTRLSDPQLQAIADYLLQVVTDPGVKLRWGARLREEIRQQLSKGQTPTGYRVNWLRETGMELIDTLQRQAQTFNDRYRHDRISVSDMCDALTTTLAQLKAASEKADGKGRG